MDPVSIVKTGAAVIGEIAKLPSDNPDARSARAQLAKAANTVLATINTALLPLLVLNAAADRARKYFAEEFPKEIEVKLRGVPPDQIIEPRPSVAGPAMQGLAYSHTEPELKEMYLSIIANEMKELSRKAVHPAFVEILRQMEVSEIQHLRRLAMYGRTAAIVEIRKSGEMGEKGWQMLRRHLCALPDPITGTAMADDFNEAVVDNWIRLGLVGVDYSTVLIESPDPYEWVLTHPEYLMCVAGEAPVRVHFHKGCMELTAFGWAFVNATGMLGAAPSLDMAAKETEGSEDRDSTVEG